MADPNARGSLHDVRVPSVDYPIANGKKRRGKRMLGIEPRMTGGGKYELRTLDLREDTAIDFTVAERLIREAIRLNRAIGSPTERK